MKITLIELNLWYSIVTHQSALTPISDFFPSSKVATTWQTDGTVYKLKPRSFYKSVHLQVHFVDFYSSVNCVWQYYQTPKSSVASEQFHLLNPLSQFCLQYTCTSYFKVQMTFSYRNSSTPVSLLGILFQYNLAFQWPDGLFTKCATILKINLPKRLFISKVSFQYNST